MGEVDEYNFLFHLRKAEAESAGKIFSDYNFNLLNSRCECSRESN